MRRAMTFLMVVLATVLAGMTGARAGAQDRYAPTNWPWGADVDESMFAPGGDGVVLHVDASAKPGGDGSRAKPFATVREAIRKAGELRQALVTHDHEVSDLSLPQWLRLERKGQTIRALIADDRGGQPGDWREVSSQTVRMTGSDFVGLHVSNDDHRDEPFAEARFSRVTLDGKPVPADAWQVWREDAKGEILSAESGSLTLTGMADDAAGGDRDNRFFVHLPVEGDFTFTARLEDAKPGGRKERYVASLELRDALTAGARRMEIAGVSIYRGPKVRVSHRQDAAEGGKSVKITVHPSLYRPGAETSVSFDEVAAAQGTLVIEGQGQHGEVVISGSATDGWEPATWKRAGEGVYSHAWPKDYKRKVHRPTDRAEFLAISRGGDRSQRVHLSAIDAEGFADAGPGAYVIDEAAGEVRIRLPEGWTDRDFSSALVEVTDNRHAWLNIENMDNFVLRNLVIEHFAHERAAVVLNWIWSERDREDRNWLWEDLTFQQNPGGAVQLDHLHDFTFRNQRWIDNGQSRWLASEGQMIDSEITTRYTSPTFWQASKNILFHRLKMNGNRGIAFRNDHVAENLLLIDCEFNDNGDMALMFETATGPITVRDTEIRRNNHASEVGTRDDSAVGLSTVHNITFDNVLFENNHISAIALYPRERAHTAKKRGHDELPNNFDHGQWGAYTAPGLTLTRAEPGLWKPGALNRNMIIRNCTFLAVDPEDDFIIQHYYDRDDGYDDNVKFNLMAYNNLYFHPNNPDPFEIESDGVWQGEGVWGDFAAWKATSTRDDFEAGSAWGRSAPRDYELPQPELATPGDDASPVNAGDVLRYEVERLPFETSARVQRIADSEASGGELHKLLADQMGDYGDYVAYSLDVPEAGEWYVQVRYLRDGGPFNYLGYAQAVANPAEPGRNGRIRPLTQGTPLAWWDQSARQRHFASVPVGKVQLQRGRNVLRFEPVHKDGYWSGDYDITIDAIELSPQPQLIPAVDGGDVGSAKPGLVYRYYEVDLAMLDPMPAFAKLQPMGVGAVANVDLSVRRGKADYAMQFTGWIDVPTDGIYTFYTLVNGGVNLTIDGQRVIDSDGEHGDWEKNEPWQKQGRVALAAGRHRIAVDYYDPGGSGSSLEVFVAPPGGDRQPIPDAWLSHSEQVGDIAATGGDGESLLPQGDFGRAAFPAEWTFEQSWAADRISLQGDGPGAFVRLVSPPQSFVETSIDLPPGIGELGLAARVRQQGFKQGAKPWDVSMVTLEWVMADGKRVSATEWGTLVKFTRDHDWEVVRQAYPVPEGAERAVIAIKYKSAEGTLDIDWLQAYDAARPPRVTLDAPSR